MSNLSEKVLARKKMLRTQRRDAVVANTLVIGTVLILISWFAFLYHQEKLLTQPTWADFVSTSDLKEFVGPVNKDGMPNTFIVNGEQWSFAHVDHFADTTEEKVGSIMAETYCANKTIAYITDNDARHFRVSIMHELFHAGACLHGGDSFWNTENGNNTDHPGIYHLGEYTSELLHENPKLMNWLVQY